MSAVAQCSGAFSENEERRAASLAHLHLSHVSLTHQAAEVSQKKLEQEVAAFLSMLKNDGLSERKTYYFTLTPVSFCHFSSEPLRCVIGT